jgi:preprotein translocase SecE subunit
MGFTQYLKDTRGELNHVAWPTRNETVIYTILVAAISIGVAVYLGFFDFVFTSGLSRALTLAGAGAPVESSIATTSTSTVATSTPATSSTEEEPITNPTQEE